MAMALFVALAAQSATSAPPPESPAAPAPVAGRSSFDPAFFADFAPRTALDMVARLPGFTLQEGLVVRGLSGGGGNVFVDGARPATKDIGLEEVLRRIPAAYVRQIDIVDGSTMGVEAAGYPLVANVVLLAGASGSGVATLRAIGTTSGGTGASGQLSWQGQAAGFNLAAGAEYGTNNLNRLNGTQSLIRAQAQPGGEGSVAGPMAEWRSNRAAAVNLSIGRRFGPLTTTAALSRRETPFRRNALFSARPLDGAGPGFENTEVFAYTERADELSLSSEALLGAHKLKLVVLGSRTELDTVSEAGFRFVDRPDRGSSFVLDQQRDEWIGRGSWGASFGKVDASMAIERAHNQLRARTMFDTVPALPAPTEERTDVRESRLTVEAGLVWTLDPRLNINAVLARETSTITVRMPAPARNRYVFVRGRMAANLQPMKGLTVTAQFERTIGQLDFGDFVGAQQLFDGSATVSNAELRPSQTNSLALAVDARPAFGGALNLRVSRNLLRDVVETVPLGDGRQGVGNMPRATELVAELSMTIPLTSIWRGTDLAVAGRWRQTRLTDPFNGQVRSLQGETGDPLQIELRRAVDAHLNYGLTYRGTFQSMSFRRELLIDYAETRSFGAYVERTFGTRWKARASAERLGGRRIDRDLLIFADVRGLSPIVQTERRRRGDAPLLQLRLERQL